MDHEVYRVVPDAQQHDRVEGLPFGTRGGLAVRHLFPLDGEYDIKVDVTGANAIREPQQLEVTIDGVQVAAVHAGWPRRRGLLGLRLGRQAGRAGVGAGRPA